jgi:hypothetical protein
MTDTGTQHSDHASRAFDNDATMDEKRAVLRNERRLREAPEPTTYFEMASAKASTEADAASGRFGAVTNAAPALDQSMLVGPAWAADPTGPEPPLGIRVDDLPNLLTANNEWPEPAAEEQTDEA